MEDMDLMVGTWHRVSLSEAEPGMAQQQPLVAMRLRKRWMAGEEGKAGEVVSVFWNRSSEDASGRADGCRCMNQAVKQLRRIGRLRNQRDRVKGSRCVVRSLRALPNRRRTGWIG